MDRVVMGRPDSAGQKDEHRTGLSWDGRTARDRRMNNGQGCHGTARDRRMNTGEGCHGTAGNRRTKV
jgi:hypothetical protein